ncbi:MAG TPA: grasp-with-spasm system ATP-grasp peptide maturase [Longimicrobium sp.]|nr:grasp-with-spasm system ATP-grasp peptide maturase [Longimicrobium sp.]
MIVILSELFDPSTDRVMDWVGSLGYHCERVNGEQVDDGTAFSLRLDATAALWDTITRGAEEVRAVWYRRWGHARRYQAVPLFNEAAAAMRPYRVDVSASFHLSRELGTLSECVFAAYDGACWLGDPSNEAPNKLLVLREAARAGLDVPATLVSTEREAVRDFAAEHGRIVMKPLGDVAIFNFERSAYLTYTAECTVEMLEQVPPRFFPTLFQERLDKEYELRVFYLAGELYPMAIFSRGDPQTEGDFRRYNRARPNRNVPYALPAEVEERLRALMEALKLNTGSIDLVRTPCGRYVFLEVNPIGQFGMVSAPCNYHLERRVAEHLIEMSGTRHG